MIKLFVVLLFSTAFIFSFSHYGAKAFGKLTNAEGKFSEGTTIGALNISGKTEDQAKSLLAAKYVDWVKDTSIQLQYGEKSVLFDINQFHLDAIQTVDSIKDGQNNPAFISVDPVKVKEQLEILFPKIKTNDIDIEKLTLGLNTTAGLFQSGSQTLNLYNDFLIAGKIKKDAVINSAVIEIEEMPFGLESVIKKNSDIEISEEATFSLLEFAEKQKIEDSDILNLLATGIYQSILPTNFSIVERNISSSLPEYSNIGYEAKVNSSKKADLVIVNPNKAKYILELHLEEKQLKFTLKGEQPVYTYEISLKDNQKLAPKTIIQYSPLLLPGKTKIQSKGEEGQIVKVYRKVYQGDEFIKSELISEDYYPPSYRVEIRGLAGSAQASTQTTDTSNDQVDNSTPTTESTSPDGNQTTETSNNSQADSNDNDLWGKPNEEPK